MALSVLVLLFQGVDAMWVHLRPYGQLQELSYDELRELPDLPTQTQKKITFRRGEI